MKRHHSRREGPAGRAKETIRLLPIVGAPVPVERRGKNSTGMVRLHPSRKAYDLFRRFCGMNGVAWHADDGIQRFNPETNWYQVYALPGIMADLWHAGFVALMEDVLDIRPPQVGQGAGAAPKKVSRAERIGLVEDPRYAGDTHPDGRGEKPPQLCKEWAGRGYLYYWVREVGGRIERTRYYSVASQAKTALREGKCDWLADMGHTLPLEPERVPYSSGEGFVAP